MKRGALVGVVVSSMILLAGGFTYAVAQDTKNEQICEEVQVREIYGSEMMTDQERAEYRARLRAAASDEEREKIRLEHHKRMEWRAKARGLSLTDKAPTNEQHRQPMGSFDSGMGSGSGSGSGSGLRKGGKR